MSYDTCPQPWFGHSYQLRYISKLACIYFRISSPVRLCGHHFDRPLLPAQKIFLLNHASSNISLFNCVKKWTGVQTAHNLDFSSTAHPCQHRPQKNVTKSPVSKDFHVEIHAIHICARANKDRGCNGQNITIVKQPSSH